MTLDEAQETFKFKNYSNQYAATIAANFIFFGHGYELKFYFDKKSHVR